MSTKKSTTFAFRIRIGGEVIPIGSLYWPFPARVFIDHGDYIEIYDDQGEPVVIKPGARHPARPIVTRCASGYQALFRVEDAFGPSDVQRVHQGNESRRAGDRQPDLLPDRFEPPDRVPRMRALRCVEPQRMTPMLIATSVRAIS